MCDQKVKCGSCLEMFTSETNATLCSVCSKEVSNPISSSVRVWDYKMAIVNNQYFSNQRTIAIKRLWIDVSHIVKEKKDSNDNNGDVGINSV